jgi:hypothetical protein
MHTKSIINLSNILYDNCVNFIVAEMEKENKIEDELEPLINLILSSHFSSLFNLLRKIGNENPDCLEVTEALMRDLEASFSKVMGIKKINNEKQEMH